jgi:hypothetical protein
MSFLKKFPEKYGQIFGENVYLRVLRLIKVQKMRWWLQKRLGKGSVPLRGMEGRGNGEGGRGRERRGGRGRGAKGMGSAPPKLNS